MALKGKSTTKAIPYIPEIERGNTENPTIFWVRPKNMRSTYDSLENFSKGANVSGKGQRTINPQKMVEADMKDFVSFCEKVENFEFSDAFSELHDKGVMREVTDEGTLRLLYQDLDPSVFQEVQNASANWEALDQGQSAYENLVAFKKASGKR